MMAMFGIGGMAFSLITAVLLSTATPTVYDLAPLVVIIILIVAATGLTKGVDLFTFFGIGTLLGVTGKGGGSSKGFKVGTAGTRFANASRKYNLKTFGGIGAAKISKAIKNAKVASAKQKLATIEKANMIARQSGYTNFVQMAVARGLITSRQAKKLGARTTKLEKAALVRKESQARVGTAAARKKNAATWWERRRAGARLSFEQFRHNRFAVNPVNGRKYMAAPLIKVPIPTGVLAVFGGRGPEAKYIRAEQALIGTNLSALSSKGSLYGVARLVVNSTPKVPPPALPEDIKGAGENARGIKMTIPTSLPEHPGMRSAFERVHQTATRKNPEKPRDLPWGPEVATLHLAGIAIARAAGRVSGQTGRKERKLIAEEMANLSEEKQRRIVEEFNAQKEERKTQLRELERKHNAEADKKKAEGTPITRADKKRFKEEEKKLSKELHITPLKIFSNLQKKEIEVSPIQVEEVLRAQGLSAASYRDWNQMTPSIVRELKNYGTGKGAEERAKVKKKEAEDVADVLQTEREEKVLGGKKDETYTVTTRRGKVLNAFLESEKERIKKSAEESAEKMNAELAAQESIREAREASEQKLAGARKRADEARRKHQESQESINKRWLPPEDLEKKAKKEKKADEDKK